MANGVLASYQSATTKYSHAYVDQTNNPNGLVRADFPMYTTPSATLTSGSLRMMNTTGSTATVDVAIQDYTEAIQFAAPGSQSPTVTNFSEFSFAPNDEVTSSYVIISGHNGTAYVPGETITITGSGLGGTNTAKVIAWDAANLKIWYALPVGSWPVFIQSTLTVAGAGGGSGTVTDSYVGTSGRCVMYDRLTGTLLMQNDSIHNNVKSRYFTEPTLQRVSGIGGAGQLSVSSRALEWNPSLSTVTLYNAANTSGTQVTAEWKMTTGTNPEVIIASVAYSNDQNKILKSYPIPNNSEVSLTGLVLEQWQNLYVSASAGVAFNFIGFEESVTIS